MADFLDAIIQTEGSRETNDPDDAGGRTKYGISERFNPDLWNPGPPTYEQARKRFLERYCEEPGYDKIFFIPLRNQLTDFAVNAGAERATNTLQAILGVKRDGDLGPKTLAAFGSRDPKDVNNRLVAARCAFYYALAKAKPTDKKFLKGWLKRAKSFLLP
jgi:lysozyme family protein